MIYMENMNNITEFVLLTQNPKLQNVIFAVFLVIYIVSMAGNVLTLVTITVIPLLGSPMYFFLAHLSFIDACYSSVNNLKLIVDSLHETKTILFNECMTQIFGEHLFADADVILMTAMAYDHYEAICKLLHYTTIMNWQLCWLLTEVVWVGRFLHATIQILFIFHLPFCSSNVIDHFMCDLNPLLELTCSDTHTLGLFIAANSGFLCLLNFLLLLGFYVVIVCSLRTYSLEVRHKALSTCVSHITAVIIFLVPCIFVYLIPATTFPIDKEVTVFYTMITPMLNAFIYTQYRNAQMKNAIRNLCNRKVISGDR
ncbi:olfactory receptor 4C46-like [Oryx dammah]|uniref:olfactory receptor 4C46-like n=1 Tax=Oryx dammah TaxID=59534 RepID=UPI001A9AC517|nr:olfactory receptor 4C46-like [Oryx dammah]